MEQEKTFFSIGEVSNITEIPTHIIRYWEKELKSFKPLRDKRGHRIFTKKEIAKVTQLKQLIYQEGYRLKGAKKKLRSASGKEKNRSDELIKFLKNLVKKLKEIEKTI